MRKIYRSLLVMGSVLLLLMGSFMSSADAKFSSRAERLVVAMGMGKAALIVAQIPFLQSQQTQGRVLSEREQEILECIKSTDTAIYTDTFAGEVSKHLSVEEVDLAIQFFEGAEGKRLNERSSIEGYQMLGLDTEDELKDLVPNDVAALDMFQKTTAGDKLIGQGILSDVSLQKQIILINKSVLKGCFERSGWGKE